MPANIDSRQCLDLYILFLVSCSGNRTHYFLNCIRVGWPESSETKDEINVSENIFNIFARFMFCNIITFMHYIFAFRTSFLSDPIKILQNVEK